jgi:hypothetical protein
VCSENGKHQTQSGQARQVLRVYVSETYKIKGQAKVEIQEDKQNIIHVQEIQRRNQIASKS